MSEETLVEWPSFAIPEPLIEPHSEQIQNSVIRTQWESGRARQRKRFEVNSHFHSVQWNLSRSQMAAFEAFVRHGIDGGALWFTINLRLADEFKEYRCRLADGDYRVSQVDHWYRVSGTLEIENQPILDTWQMTYDYIVMVEADGGEVGSIKAVFKFYDMFE